MMDNGWVTADDESSSDNHQSLAPGGPNDIIFALLIEATTAEGEFRRCGLARVPVENALAMKGCQKRTVKII